MATYLHPGVYVEEIPGAKPITGVSTSTGAFVGVAEIGPYNEPILVTSWNQFVDTFGIFLWSRYLAYAVYAFFLQGGSVCYIVRSESDIQVTDTPTGDGGLTLTFVPTSPGDWPNYLMAKFENYPYTATTSGTTESDLFTLAIVYRTQTLLQSASSTSAQEQQIQEYILANGIVPQQQTDDSGSVYYYYYLETYPGLNFSNTYSGTSSDAEAMQIAQDAVQAILDLNVNSASLFVRVQAEVTSIPFTRPQNQDLQLVGTTTEPVYDYITGVNALDPIENVNILLLPDLSSTVTDQTKLTATIQQCLTYSEARSDLFFVVDPPQGYSVQDMLTFRAPFNSAYGALYYPWIQVLDPSNNNLMMLPPSGSVAGIYAETDRTVGVWKAPAGTQDGQLKMAVGLEVKLTDSDQDVLNPNNIDALRELYQIGNVVWGARTLAADPEWLYINVRRLISYIEASLKRASLQYVFEPNSPQLWTRVNRDFSDFLTNLWRAGALFGMTASEAFYVIVDESNNPPQTRALGELYIDVGVAPVKPAEFVIIRIKQIVPPS